MTTRIIGAALALIATAAAADAQDSVRRVSPTTSVSVSKGEVALSPWRLTPQQFRSDIERLTVPSTCTGRINRNDVTGVAIKADLYRPGMISPDSAKFLALCVIPGQISSGEMHEQDGRTMYEVTLIPDRRSVHAKVIVDARTGEVLSSKTYGGLRGLAGFLRENVERQENKADAGADAAPQRPAPGVMCTMEARAGLQVAVRDANGQELPANTHVWVSISDGAYRDSSMVMPGAATSTASMAYERAGSYRVRVSAPGYTPVVFDNVVVGRTPDGCHVQTRKMTATLKR